jgi:putative photosynthetic complex assembly protein 2
VGAIRWHELAIAAGGLLVLLLVVDQPNRVSLWTYGVLWAMRTSAKLNLHFGVRNPGLELLPRTWRTCPGTSGSGRSMRSCRWS